MLNKVSHRYIEGLVPLEGNGGKFIGIKNGELVDLTTTDLLYNIDVAPTQPFCVNSCAKDFIRPYGFTIEGNQLTVSPITVKDSTNTVDIELKETITKTSGMFIEGDNKGCKDDSFVQWKQPLMNDSANDLAEIYDMTGFSTNQPYHLMDGVLYDDAHSWLGKTTEMPFVTFMSPINFIVESIILVNTSTANRTRSIDIKINYEKVIDNYFCNADANAYNYINIPKDKRTEWNNLELYVNDAFVGTTIGFSEMIINARTRSIQQDSKYNVFLIANEDQSKVDILLSSLKEPLLPEGFTYYAFLKEIETEATTLNFKSSLGDDIHFGDELPTKITNAKGETTYLDSINYIHFDNVDSQDELLYNIYIKADGTAYARNNAYYKNASDLPLTPNVGDVVGYTKNALLEAYEWNGETWIEFNDVPVGEIYRQNNKTIKIVQFPCNNNFYVKCIDNNVWREEDTYIANKDYVYEHGLDIKNITDYNYDYSAICIANDSDYVVGDKALIVSPVKPYLTKTTIGLRVLNIQAINKASNAINLTSGKWKLVFRIWR